MTQAVFLVTRASGDEGSPMIDGIFAVAINEVSTANNATVIAAAVAQCNASKNSQVEGDTSTILGPAPFPPNYFDTVAQLSDLSGGPIATAGAAAIFGGIGSEASVDIIT